MTHETQYLSLKSASVDKMSDRSTGKIHYRVLTDSNHQSLFFILTGNDDGGHFSPEMIPFERVEQCLLGLEPNTAIFSKVFANAFVSRSANNAGFLAAILRAEHLISPKVDAVRKHSVLPGWEGWKESLLAEAGEVYELANAVIEPSTIVKKVSHAKNK